MSTSNSLNQLYTNLNPQASLFPVPHSAVDRTVLRNGIRFYTTQCQSIPYPVAAAYFHYYKLLYWSGAHILESIEAGMIVRDNIAFIVKYHKDLTRGYILKHKDAQYKMSFRAPLDSWNIDPVVIISECTES